MKILGIETSCDETAASIVKNGKEVLSNIIASSLKIHKKYGGVIPEIASRKQLEFINSVVEESLAEAKTSLKGIDAIAVTTSPGLMGSLLVGISFARALSLASGKPLIEVDHIKAHLYASFLEQKKSIRSGFKNKLPKLPVIGLVVSGGHTSLYKITDFNKFKLLGHTLDDAAGEAFDKVAKILELGYPGGPEIDRLAKKAIKRDIHFTCAQLPDTFNFSFSGIKTGVLYHCRDAKKAKGLSVNEVAYAFQNSIVSTLVKKSIAACKKAKICDLVVGGGVAANSSLREKLTQEASKEKIKVYFPEMSLCTDNAAIIAGLGYHLYRKGV